MSVLVLASFLLDRVEAATRVAAAPGVAAARVTAAAKAAAAPGSCDRPRDGRHPTEWLVVEQNCIGRRYTGDVCLMVQNQPFLGTYKYRGEQTRATASIVTCAPTTASDVIYKANPRMELLLAFLG